MNIDTFFVNFGYLADAPNGVKKLRELILQLAVQGKLVTQEPNDEPASKLLERIQLEKARLLKEKKIKRAEPLPSVNLDEVTYELPKGWEWSRLAEIGIVNPINDVDDNIEASFIPMALISVKYGKAASSETKVWREIKKGFTHFAENDVVLAKITPCFQNGKSAVMRGLKNGVGAGTTELHVFRQVADTMCPDYVLIYFKSADFINSGIQKMTGSAGQKRVPKEYFSYNPFPLPPLAEQHRIAAKVDQLMALCDELEKRQQKKKQKLVNFNNAALDRLVNARVPDDFANAWRLIRDNFDFLYTAPGTITKLRQAILQLAVQGKLVPQDPKDEQASVLLAKIKDEKEQLVKEKKIRKTPPLPPVSHHEAPYELPKGWEWILLDDISINVHYGYTASADHNRRDVRLLRITDIQNGRVNWDWVPGCEIDDRHLPIYALKNNDLLIARTGGTIGKTFLVEGLEVCAVFASYLIRVIPSGFIVPLYLKQFTESPLYWFQLYGKSMGTGQPNVNSVALRSLIVPLPSYAEQHRIVTKVDQLMKLCDELETRLSKSETEAEKLAVVAVQAMVAT